MIISLMEQRVQDLWVNNVDKSLVHTHTHTQICIIDFPIFESLEVN